jgi:hypothetical protein
MFDIKKPVIWKKIHPECAEALILLQKTMIAGITLFAALPPVYGKCGISAFITRNCRLHNGPTATSLIT